MSRRFNSFGYRRFAAVAPQRVLLYSLDDYTCDGTVNTFIDTGVRMFSRDYDKYTIELEFDSVDQTAANNATLLECKDNTNSSSPGFKLIRATGSLSMGTGIVTNTTPISTERNIGNVSSGTFFYEYTGANNSYSFNGSQYIFNGGVSHNQPLTVGGRYNENGIPDRFLSFHIVSLRVYGEKSSASNIIYQLYNYTCDGTVATAINTGIYLFDTTLYPNGWTIELEFSFTKHVNQGSVLRCRNAASPYNGISARNHNNNNNAQVQVNTASFSIIQTIGNRLSVTFDYTPPMCTATGRNVTTSGASNTINASMSGLTVNPPLVIGGENNDDSASLTWKSGRFPKCVIHSLVITAKE